MRRLVPQAWGRAGKLPLVAVALLGVSSFVALSVLNTPQLRADDTGFLNPSAQAADTGGDGNGFQSNPNGAFADGGARARDNNSGTNTSASCADPGKDRHRYFKYSMSVPPGVTIDGLEVRLDAFVGSTAGNPFMCVELSWDGGANWTAVKTTGSLSTAEATYLLGGSADTWGHAWTASELSNANFLLRITNVAASTSAKFRLEWVAIRIYFTPPPTATDTAVPPTATEAPTSTPLATATAVPPTATEAPTSTPLATATAVPPTATAVPTSTPLSTATAVPPTATAVPTSTPLATDTAVPPTATEAPTSTPLATDTVVPPTATAAAVAVAVPTAAPPTATSTPAPTAAVPTATSTTPVGVIPTPTPVSEVLSTAVAPTPPSTVAPGATPTPAALSEVLPTQVAPVGEIFLTADVDAGETILVVNSTVSLSVGDLIRINPGGANEEDNEVAAFGSLIIARPLQFAHAAGERVIKMSSAAATRPVETPASEVAALPRTGVGGRPSGGWVAPSVLVGGTLAALIGLAAAQLTLYVRRSRLSD